MVLHITNTFCHTCLSILTLQVPSKMDKYQEERARRKNLQKQGAQNDQQISKCMCAKYKDLQQREIVCTTRSMFYSGDCSHAPKKTHLTRRGFSRHGYSPTCIPNAAKKSVMKKSRMYLIFPLNLNFEGSKHKFSCVFWKAEPLK